MLQSLNPNRTEVTGKVFIDIVYDYPGIHSDGWGGMGTEGRSRWEFPIKIQRGDSNRGYEKFHLRTAAHILQKTWIPTSFKRE